MLREAAEGSSAASRQALGRLYETYWPPVYAFVRSRGHSPSDAEDLTQAYFARFLEKGYLADFRPEVGRFRTFLRASVSHFLANEWDRVRALKRGGGQVVLSLDAVTAEERLRLEPVDRLTPEAVFERLKAFLSSDGADAGYSTLARELGLSEAAARVAVHRLRRRFAAVLREEILETVSDPREVDAEIRWLLEAVRRKG